MDNALLTGKRVLVIEDEMLVLMILEDLFGDLGCTSVTAAGSVQTAMALLAENTFDLATLDVNLNGTLAYAVAEALEANKIPFAFSTGYSEHGVDPRYQGHPVLRKPFRRFQFEKMISELLYGGAPPALAA